MARSISPDHAAADEATTQLLALCAHSTGFMRGTVGSVPDGWYAPGRDNAAFIGALDAALNARYPQAGPAFRAVRLYTSLLWQPAYLLVIATHLHGAVPDLSHLGQQRRGVYVDGFRLPAQPLWRGSTEAMIAQAAAQLRAFAETVLDEVNHHSRLRPLPARRLLADRVLSLMVWLSYRRRDVPAATIRQWCDQWLEALDVTGQGTLQSVWTRDGQELLVVQRKGCCLDYRIDPTLLCASCPKQQEPVRLARQMANALAEWA